MISAIWTKIQHFSEQVAVEPPSKNEDRHVLFMHNGPNRQDKISII
jgi:hypothetical protein